MNLITWCLRGIILLGIMLLTGTAGAENIVFPGDAGLFNVRDYGAIPDDDKDDTEAIQRAITETIGDIPPGPYRILYFPDGVYNVSRQLAWKRPNGGFAPRIAFQGQSRARTILRLRNNCNGQPFLENGKLISTDDFTNVDRPRAVILTAGANDAGSDGGGNTAFGNSLRNLTIDTGARNAGAAALDWQCSNHGTVRDVILKTSDPRHAGYAGLWMHRGGPNGPALVKNVWVDGFDTGIVSTSAYSLTFENILLTNQRGLGWYNDTAASVRSVRSRNRVPVFRNGGLSLLTLVDGDFSTPDGKISVNAPAIINELRGIVSDQNPYFQATTARIFLRNVVATSYRCVVQNRDGNDIPGKRITEWTSDPVVTLFPSSPRSLQLPVRETPEYFDTNLNNWKSITSEGAVPYDEGDDSAAIQRAMDSGKSTIYFPRGNYTVTRTIRVPPSVKHIYGAFSILYYGGKGFAKVPVDKAKGVIPSGSRPVFLFTNGKPADKTTLEYLIMYPQDNETAGSIGIRHADRRTLIVRHTELSGEQGAYWTDYLGVGPLFIEDVAGGSSSGLTYRFEVAQTVWMRQVDPEGDRPTAKIYNSGATVWILGLKTEGLNTIIHTRNNGRTEVLGGCIAVQGKGDVPEETPMILNDNSRVSASLLGFAVGGGGRFYTIGVQEKRGTKVRNWNARTYWNGDAGTIPLYSSLIRLDK